MIAQMVEFLELMFKEISELKKQLKLKQTREPKFKRHNQSSWQKTLLFCLKHEKVESQKRLANKIPMRVQVPRRERETPKNSVDQNKRPRKKKQRPQVRPEAVVIEKCKDIDLANVLKKLTHDESLKDVGDQAAKVRTTQNGDMLLVLKRGKEAVQVEAGINNALRDKASVRSLAPTTEITVAEEIAEALKQQLAIGVDHMNIKI
uniref:Uncharacterized protein n=1 Tax=Anopheles arabiensis TaxID=7173 RepID=A0A182ICV9_ANOAR